MPMTLRVLVTGSREWPHPDIVCADLTRLLDSTNVLVVVHGACRSGADWYAHEWCTSWQGLDTFRAKDVIEEPHPAAWNTYGKKAGPIRNSQMVALGADVCLAYPLGLSFGTRDCMGKATKAEINVWNRTVDLGLE